MIEEKVKLFIKEKTRYTISEESKFFIDLSLWGLDAEMFIEEFANEFNVDMTLFPFEKHFPSDISLSFLPSETKVGELNKDAKSLEDIVKIIREGVWK